jgi:ribose-phosphate pyrophosphokinase
LKRRGAARIVACAVHAILSGDAAARLIASDVEQLIITDTLPVSPEKLNHKVQVLTVAPLLAEAIMRIHKDLSISAMFV